MTTPSISNYTPQDILRKEPFRRLLPSEDLAVGMAKFTPASGASEYKEGNLAYEVLTQAEFMREYNVNSHKINSYKYRPNPFNKDTNNEVHQKILSRTAVPMQAIIHLKRTVALTGKGVRKRILSPEVSATDQEKLAAWQAAWARKGMEKAIRDFIYSDGKVGDSAVCLYLSDGKLGWRAFSYEKGDTLYPHYDPITGELALFGRKYAVRSDDGKEMVQYLDVWDKKNYMRYRYNQTGVQGAVAKGKKALGLSPWMVDAKPVPHKFSRVPVVYDRYGEPFWAQSQECIDQIEMVLSDLSENNRAYALRILLAFGQDMHVTTDFNGTPSLIESSDPNAQAKFLEPADSSGSLDVQLKWLKDMAYKGSFIVETPEIKSGSDLSGLAVRTMFADSFLKGQDDADHFYPALQELSDLFTYGWGIESGEPSAWSNFHVQLEIEPFVFMSESDEINALVQLKGIGAISRRSATERAVDMAYGVASENERVLQEEHDALLGVNPTQTEQNPNPVADSRVSK